MNVFLNVLPLLRYYLLSGET